MESVGVGESRRGVHCGQRRGRGRFRSQCTCGEDGSREDEPFIRTNFIPSPRSFRARKLFAALFAGSFILARGMSLRCASRSNRDYLEPILPTRN